MFADLIPELESDVYLFDLFLVIGFYSVFFIVLHFVLLFLSVYFNYTGNLTQSESLSNISPTKCRNRGVRCSKYAI